MGRGDVHRFGTFHVSSGSAAYDKGYDAIDWGKPAEVSPLEHRGYAGYRLKRVKTTAAPAGGAPQEGRSPVLPSGRTPAIYEPEEYREAWDQAQVSLGLRRELRGEWKEPD